MNSKKMHNKITGYILIALGICFAIILVPKQEAIATSANATIFEKVLAQGIRKCYTGGAVKRTISPILSSTDSSNSYNGVAGFLTENANDNNNPVLLVTGIGSDAVGKPASYNVTDSNLTCAEFFKGGNYGFGGSNAGIFAVTGKKAPEAEASKIGEIKSFLENMGYSVESAGSNDTCIYLNYEYSIGQVPFGNNTTNAICKDSNGNLRTQSNGNASMGADLVVNSNGEACLVFMNGVTSSLTAGCRSLTNPNDFSEAWVKGIIANASCANNSTVNTCSCEGQDCTYQNNPNGAQPGPTFSFTFGNATSQPSSDGDSAHFDNAAQAGLAAASYLLGKDFDELGDIKIDAAEKRILYQDYLTNYYGIEVECMVDLEYIPDDKRISWYENGSIKTCQYKDDHKKNTDKPVNGVDSDGFLAQNSIGSLDAMITAVKSLPSNSVTSEELSEMEQLQESGEFDQGSGVVSGNGSGGSSGGSDINKQCKQDAGLEGISWIVCPVVANSAKAADGFEKLIGDWLSTPSKLYKSKDDAGNETAAYRVWKSARDIANIIIVLVLIVVIFSQLTGFGIDNYGIKRILPRLIVMAILINLSFVLCQVLIDLSNIFGSGLSQLFKGEGSNDGTYIAAVVGVILASIGTIGVGVAAVVIAGPMVAISLVLSLLSAVSGILLLFLTIGAREMIIIVFTAVSPIALACYILPNTQSIFKRWWKIFSAALIVYPICGALYGLSFVIRSMFMGGQEIENVIEFLEAFLALLAPFLPFFVMPSLLKSSLSGLGAVGNAVTALGNGIRKSVGYANKQVRGTDAYKFQANEGRMNILRRRIGMDRNGILTKRGQRLAKKYQEKGGAVLRRHAANISTVEKDRSARQAAGSQLMNVTARTDALYAGDHSAETDLGKGFSKGSTASAYGEKFLQAAANGDTDNMTSAVEAMINGGVQKKLIAQMMRYAQKNGKINISDQATRQAWWKDMANRHGDVMSTDYELKDFAISGGQGTLGEYGDRYANAGMADDGVSSMPAIDGNDIDKSDIGKLSGNALAAYVTSKQAKPGDMMALLAENPNLSGDKKVMLGIGASGRASGMKAKELKDITTYLSNDPDMKNLNSASQPVKNGIAKAGITSDMVKKWIKPAPVRANVVQDFVPDQDRQEMPVWTDDQPPIPTPAPKPTPAPPAPTPTPTQPPAPTP